MNRAGWAVAALALLLAACSGAAADTVVTGEEVSVLMYDDQFQYTEIRIPEGGSVDWIGAGRNPHNAVAADGSWSTDTVFGDLEQYEGETARLTYDQPGEYLFFCTFHGNADGEGMAGVLIVGGQGAEERGG